MQNGKMIGAILLGVVVFFFVYQQLGAPALLVLAVVVGAALLFRYKLRSYPEAGWRYTRALALMAALATGAWTAIALLSGRLPVALVSGLVFAGMVLWVNHCTKKMRAASGAPAKSEARGGASRSTRANQIMLDQTQLGMQTLANNRRSAERGQKMHLQGENLDLTKTNQELQAEVERLKGQVGELTNALEDPFYDPPAPVQKVGS